MNKIRLIFRTLAHYRWSGIATAAGIAIATAVICGALIVGDSLRKSLLKIVDYRLGDVTHTITTGERLATAKLAHSLNQEEDIFAAAILKTEATATIQGTELSLNNIQVWGVDSAFSKLQNTNAYDHIKQGEVLISDNLAQRLALQAGDEIMLRMRTIGPIPPNTPFVSDEGQTIARRVRIAGIAERLDGGHFNTETAQTTPYNIFIDFGWLNRVMSLSERCNLIAIRTGTSVPDIQQTIKKYFRAEDAGLELTTNAGNSWLIRSERVFIDTLISSGISRTFPGAKPTLSYFANQVSFGNISTPYSFVNATNQFPQLKPGNILINKWMADDLGVKPGDSITMEYFEVGLLRDLQVKKLRCKVHEVISMDEAIPDKELIPHLPGLTDAGSCRDWNAGIPIDLKSIRTKDEDYWRDFKGTPKAWISLEEGERIWSNRFGNLTSLEVESNLNKEQISQLLGSAVDPTQLGLMVRAVRNEGVTAAMGGVDFSQLFAGMGIFIIAAGLMLTVLLLQFSILQRKRQWQLFSSLGFGPKLISRIVLGETLVIILAGILLGAILSVLYSMLIFRGLNVLWYDMVRTDVVTLYFNPLLVLTGMVASAVTAAIVIYLSLNKHLKEHSIPHFISKDKKVAKNKLFSNTLLIIISFVSLTLLISAILSDTNAALFLWFLTGIALLLNILMLARKILFYPSENTTANINQQKLSLLNLQRNPVRSFSIIALLAGGAFLILVLAANRKDISIDDQDKTGGTGGFQYVAETTIPILKDLNQAEVKAEFVLPEEANIISFLSAYDDNASCHNLNRVANPRIIATNTARLEGRFRFMAKHHSLDDEKPWSSLSKITGEGIIPAVADQTVMQWGLGKQVGDTLFYTNTSGREIKLLLVGALNNTVLQGNVIVDISHFNQHFPTADGASLFLIESEKENLNADDFSLAFRDYGWNMEKSKTKLAAFNSVENTYMSVFFLLGALGILLGTVGFAVMMAKTMLERRRETKLYQTLGFSKKLIFRLYFREYATLFVGGMMAGVIPALVASMPVFLAGFHNVSPWFLTGTLTALILNGLAWIYVIIKLSLKKISSP